MIELAYYAISGFLLKLVDEGIDSGRAILSPSLLAILTAVVMGLFCLENEFFASIIAGIAFGNLLAGKIDRKPHLMGLAILLSFLVLAKPSLELVFILMLGALLDEIVHDRGSRIRPILPLFVLITGIYGYIPLVHVLGILIFDLFYELARLITMFY